MHTELIVNCIADHNENVPAILDKLAGLEGRLKSLSILATATAERAVVVLVVVFLVTD